MINKIKEDLMETISKDRYEHTLRVVKTCQELSETYGADIEKVKVAALLHDSAKINGSKDIVEVAKKFNLLDDEIYLYNKALIHGPLAAKLAKEKYNIEDEEILDAIKYHTTGRKAMGLVEKIVFMGDFIEPNRSFDGINEIRRVSFIDLDRGLLLALNSNLEFLLKEGKLISKDTIEARNYLMMRKEDKKEMNK